MYTLHIYNYCIHVCNYYICALHIYTIIVYTYYIYRALTFNKKKFSHYCLRRSQMRA